MTEIRSVVACTQCQVHWYLDDEPAKCTDPGHDHHRFALHQHVSVVVLPDGTELTAVSFDARDPYARDQTPDYGLYLALAVGAALEPRPSRLAGLRSA